MMEQPGGCATSRLAAGNAAEAFALRRAIESTSGEEGWYRANPRSFDGVFYLFKEGFA